jgi:alpha 1,2-mannosyltransferase
VYGFTLSLYEYIETIPSLWASVRGEQGSCGSTGRTRTRANAWAEFMELHPEHLAEDNAMAFLSDDGGLTYNKCHCEWSGGGPPASRLEIDPVAPFADFIQSGQTLRSVRIPLMTIDAARVH